MATKKYKNSELGELGKYLEESSKKKETDSNNASSALSNSSSVQRYDNLGESLNNYLQKSSGVIRKNDYANALNAQRKAIGAAVKSAVNSATSSRLPSEINASEREAIAETTKIARFKKSEREEAAKRAKLNLKRQTSPVVNDLNDVTDAIDYVYKSQHNAGIQGWEDMVGGINAIGAGVLGGVKQLTSAISGDETAQKAVLNDTAGAWSDAFKKSYADYVNKNSSEDTSAAAQYVIERTHPKQAEKGKYSVTQIAKNVTSNAARMAPQIAMSAATGKLAGDLAGRIVGATLLGAQSSVGSYREAKEEGASDRQAADFAGLEFLNQGFGDIVIGGIGGATFGLLDKPMSVLAGAITKTPIAKTIIQASGNIAGEGLEETGQNYLTTLNKRFTYQPDAEFDVDSAVYEGVLGGINAAILGTPKTYSQYKVNRAAYDTVNSLSIAASKVSSEQDAKVISDIADQISKGADEVIADSKPETADKANAEYIKRGAEAVKKKLNESSANIVKNNQSVLEKTQEIIRTHKTSDAESLSELVNAVKESGYGGNSNNAVNNTVDYVNELIIEQNQVAKTAESIAAMQDGQISGDAQTAAVQKQKANEALEYTNTVIPQLKSISENLRSQRSEINARLKLDENTETAANQNIKQEVNTQTAAINKKANATAEAQQTITNATERVSNSAYHSETAENIRSAYEGRNIKETAENIIKAHGNVRSAVDYVHDVYAKSGGSNADASTKEYIRALDSEIRKANKPLLEKNIKRIETLLKEYGVKNVEIDESIIPEI